VALSLTGGAVLLVILATPWVAVALAGRDAPEFAAQLATHPLQKLLDVPVAYLYGLPPRAQFKLLNWVAFLLAGATFAPLLTGKSRPWLTLTIAAALYGAGRGLDHVLVLPSKDPVFWWLESPSWFLTRLALHVALTGALQALPDLLELPLRWLTALGRQSLVGYVVSVELTYGVVAQVLGLSHAVPLPILASTMLNVVVATYLVCRIWEWWLAWEKERLAAAAVKPVAPVASAG